jgi:hypothetical protein
VACYSDTATHSKIFGMDALTESIAMATKKKRRPVGPYVKTHQRAYAWADKAVAYRQEGKFEQAKAAAQRTLYWLCKAKLLGARAPRGAKRG